MDVHLSDTLNLECEIGVDFEHGEDAVVTQGDITLQHSGHGESIPMEFEHCDEQPMLMDTGSEEIIDFMGDQFSLQEYSVESDQTTGLTTTVESNQQQNIVSSQADTIIDLQFQPQLLSTIKQEPLIHHKVIAVKTASPMRSKKNETQSTPRQIAIAPKLPKLVPTKAFQPKQLPIAPKPAAMSNRSTSLVKKVSLGTVQGNSKGNTVLAQIGKQLIMVPSPGTQKLKLVSASNVIPSLQYIRADIDQSQLLQTKSDSGSQSKPILTKLIAVQGQSQLDVSQQPVVISKIGNAKTPRFLMQQKTLPISLANKVLLATPSKQGVKLAKKQEIISLKSPTPKLMPATALSSSSGGKQKLMLATNSAQNVILKPTSVKPGQASKDARFVLEGQQTQLHQINVPGKGIQYFRLVTNSSANKPAPKPLVALPGKTFMLDKGTLIPMTTDKLVGGPSASLVLSGTSATSTLTKVTAPKPGHKLVRIAPLTPKIVQTVSQAPRSSQSLLAPISPILDSIVKEDLQDSHDGMLGGAGEVNVEEDSKTAIRALLCEEMDEHQHEVEIEFKPKHSPLEDNSIMNINQQDSNEHSEHPLIVIPSSFEGNTSAVMSGPDEQREMDDSQRSANVLNIENETTNAFQSPTTPAQSEPDIDSSDLVLRPRKACNCTKSQCLKLYCDCFANGEFCNRCNCNNCHNNLENEELRQKAIKGCLERNPNAFRPKIGKAKLGGPDIIRRHNKGCNCKRSGCLKNYCECYEAKIACTSICKCIGCRNVEELLDRTLRRENRTLRAVFNRPSSLTSAKQPCSFMTTEVIEAVCQCLIAAAVDNKEDGERDVDPMRDVIEEFARCLQDIISAAQQSAPVELDEGPA